MVDPVKLDPFIHAGPSVRPEEVGIVVMQIDLVDLRAIFQRALNTWSDVPPYILALSDKLQEL